MGGGERGTGDREKNLKASCRRRRKDARHKIMLMEANRMLTFTTRTPNF